jgi:predicted ABC-type ATPase
LSTRRIVIVAGPNGSGKSTLIRQLRLDTRIDFPDQYINADDIARSLTLENQEVRERAAFHEARRLRQTYREEGVPFAFETVFSHPSNLMDLLRLKRDGYTITLVFVTTGDVEVNVGRVAARVQEGGHNVPEERIRERYVRSLRFLPRAAEVADRTFLYDSTDATRLVALIEEGTIYGEEPLPEYLERSFLVPFTQRRQERQEIEEILKADEVLVEPDEESGIYRGQIRNVGANYMLQACELDAIIRHDLVLLQTAEALEVGATVEVRYQAGYGTVTGWP